MTVFLIPEQWFVSREEVNCDRELNSGRDSAGACIEAEPRSSTVTIQSEV